MTVRPPPAGRRVGAGVLRVDAARAISKLRDFQLAEPTAWILEAIRSAVSSQATDITLQGDSNDLWLCWKGPAWQAEELPGLLNELVSPSVSRNTRQLRLLATAVNSALGLATHYIDVYCVQGEEAQKLRFRPSVLRAPEAAIEERDGEEPLLLEESTVPQQAQGGCMALHLRRKFGLGVLRNFLRGEPPEVEQVRQSCRHLAVPLRINGEVLRPARSLVSVPLVPGMDASMSLGESGAFSGHGTMEVSENGVKIVRYPVVVSTIAMVGKTPVLIRINADRMPTNASRSDVRRGEFPVANAEREVKRAFVCLCEKITELCVDPAQRLRLRSAILQLLGTMVSGQSWLRSISRLPSPVRELASLYLLKNAVGAWCAVDSAWETGVIYTGKEPLSVELAPWLPKVLWVPPGDPAAHLISFEINPDRFNERYESAKRSHQRQQRFLNAELRQARFSSPPKLWVRTSLSDASLLGEEKTTDNECEGEVCVLRNGHGGTITVLIDGRVMEEIEVESALPFVAIVASSAVKAESSYHFARRDKGFERMLSSVYRGLFRCIEAFPALEDAQMQWGDRPNLAQRKELLGKGLVLMQEQEHEIGDTSTPALFAMWPTLESGENLSLAALRKERVVGLSEELECCVPAGRVVVWCPQQAVREALRFHLGSEIQIVSYPAPADRRRVQLTEETTRQVLATDGAVALCLEEEGVMGTIAWGLPASEVQLYHCDVLLETRRYEWEFCPVSIRLQADFFIPTAGWDAVKNAEELDLGICKRWENALILAFARLLTKARPQGLIGGDGASLVGKAGQWFLLAVFKQVDLLSVLGESLMDELSLARIIPTALGRNSAHHLCSRFDGNLPYLEEKVLALKGEDWAPIVAQEPIAWLAAELTGARYHEATDRAAELVKQQQKREAMELFRQKPAMELREAQVLHSSSLFLDVELEGHRAVLALPRDGTSAMTILGCFIEGRPFQVLRLPPSKEWPHRLPMIACVELNFSDTNQALTAVREDRQHSIVRGLFALAPKLLEQALQRAPTAFSRLGAPLSLVGGWLAALAPGECEQERGRLFSMMQGKSQRGVQVSLHEASEGGEIWISSELDSPWLEPEASERDVLDRCVVLVEDVGECLKSISGLYRAGRVIDKTNALKALHLERRVRSGLVDIPTVSVAGLYKRSIGNLLQGVGIGEIGLTEEAKSWFHEYVKGEKVQSVPFDSLPCVAIAWRSTEEEGASFFFDAQGKALLSKLREALIERVVQEQEWLPLWLAKSLVKAMCQGALVPGRALAAAQLFETTAETKVSWEELQSQSKKYADVWCAGPEELRQPKDAQRIVVRLPNEVLSEATTTPLRFFDATEVLGIEERKARFRSGTAARSLPLSERLQSQGVALSRVKGLRGLRGEVAPLLPEYALHRGVRVFREMKPLGEMSDPCAWPSAAIVNDDSLCPNRLWDGVERDKRWQEVGLAISKASENSLQKKIARPRNAITSYWAGKQVGSRLPVELQRGVVIRGRCWLTESTGSGGIAFRGIDGQSKVIAESLWNALPLSLPVHGALLCVWKDAVFTGREEQIVKEVVSILYPRLLQQVKVLTKISEELRDAHLAMGLASGHLHASEVPEYRFTSFVPAKTSNEMLSYLQEGWESVNQGQPAALSRSVLLAEDSEFCRTIERVCGGTVVPQAHEEEVLLASAVKPLGGAVPAKEEGALVTKPEASVLYFHVLQPIADWLGVQLAALGFVRPIKIIEQRAQPMVKRAVTGVELGGANSFLLRIQAQRLDGQETEAMHLLLTHLISVIRAQEDQVTIGQEKQVLQSLLRRIQPTLPIWRAFHQAEITQ